MNVKINRRPSRPDATRIDRLAYLLVLLPAAAAEGAWPAFPYGELLHARHRARGGGSAPLRLDLPNRAATRAAVVFVKPDSSAFDLLAQARTQVTAVREYDPEVLGVLPLGLEPGLEARAVEAVTAALLAALHALPSFKRKPDKAPRLKRVELFAPEARFDLNRTRAEAEGNNLARSLTALPPNVLTPGEYRKRVTRLAGEHGWTLRFLGLPALRRLKAGAFLAVAQGSDSEDAGIVHLRYTPSRRSARRGALALVGKGICFDTGGTNLKPARHMHGMHEDMEGSAVALGTLLALTRLKVGFPIDCWLALAQNHIGPRAYKQNDVVTAVDGTSIEVMHTDAEGRMVLADTLALAARERPALIIDYATLTGTCIAALGTAYSGAFTNRPALREAITAAGAASGERLWPFPMDEDYDKALESEVADIKQCTLDSGPDHILAARFLHRFVGRENAWIHIDLAAGNHRGGLAHIPTDITGFGVRATLNLLLDQNVLDGVETASSARNSSGRARRGKG